MSEVPLFLGDVPRRGGLGLPYHPHVLLVPPPSPPLALAHRLFGLTDVMSFGLTDVMSFGLTDVMSFGLTDVMSRHLQHVILE